MNNSMDNDIFNHSEDERPTTITIRVKPAPKKKPIVNILLFILTVLTTLTAGALLEGINPLENPANIIKGAPFSFTLLIILLAHEFGHYFTSKRYGVDATLPYFIPAPNILGTFGAIIKMRSPITNKKALLDIGAIGPIAGAIVSIPALIIGLKMSQVVAFEGHEGYNFGSSLLISILTKLTLGDIAENMDIIIHPVGFAAWIGLFVTSLNLLPIGQLDGGHVVYAIFGKHHRTISICTIIVLIAIGISFSQPLWLVWAVLAMIFGIKHPPPLDPSTPLDRKRKLIGWATLILFIVTFIPNPFSLVGQ